ncbi:MAG: aminoacyl-tRNA hydrolase [Chloroherpetonaceae bacterium]|nr:aminoacyl-tRNA hydrolase [Chloroherpetonaceae bacterium]
MKLICGLGNIGKEYVGTRHNVGFRVAESVAEKLGLGFKSGKGDYDFAKGVYESNEVLIIKPTTYMNLSGRAVRHAMAFYKISILDLLVICDDFAIPLGAIRLRGEGSDGGQNGLKNIIQELGRNDFTRLRFGIGNPEFKGSAADFVLSNFKPEELEVVEDTIAQCRDAALYFLTHGLNPTSTKFNRKSSPLEKKVFLPKEN